MTTWAKRTQCQCRWCGAWFTLLTSLVRLGRGTYCSTACQRDASRRRKILHCETCGRAFEVKAHVNARFCSRRCTVRKVPLKQRFWKHVKKGKSNECWLWTGAIGHYGYGRMIESGTGKVLGAHRVSYTLQVGPIPKGTCVLHLCDRPPCVNPRHLVLGTKGDNSRHMVERGRSRRGSKHFRAKLTEAAVIRARKLYAKGMPLPEVAKMFGVAEATMGDAVYRMRWKHVP